MPRPIPFWFCRYQIILDEEVLDMDGQHQMFNEVQGQHIEHDPEKENSPHVLIMEPEKFETDKTRCLSWHVGRRAGVRVVAGYDSDNQTIIRQLQPDSHIKRARLIAVPNLNLLAIEDRSGDEHTGAQQAIVNMRRVVASMANNHGDLNIIHITDDEAEKALESWNLTQYDYSISQLNPISPGDLAERRSEAMKKENIAEERGVAKPKTAEGMHMNDGIIAESAALARHGYGQYGFRGTTPDGHTGHVKKPTFHRDRTKNLKEREKPRFLRMLFELGPEDEVAPTVAHALMVFYGHVK